MGLTIHYSLKASKTDDKLALMLAAQQFAAQQIKPKELSQVKHFTGKQIKQHQDDVNSDWRWSVIQSGEYIDIGDRSSIPVYPKEAYLFRMWPGEGCEEANFGLCSYPATTEFNGQRIKTRLSGWRWSSFCKTTYANEFVKCHLMVVAMLDWFDDHGLIEHVSDEGDYWEDRDIQALAATHGDDLSMIAAFAGALKDGFGDGNIAAPILDHPNFEHLEMQGLSKGLNTLALLNAIRNASKK